MCKLNLHTIQADYHFVLHTIHVDNQFLNVSQLTVCNKPYVLALFALISIEERCGGGGGGGLFLVCVHATINYHWQSACVLGAKCFTSTFCFNLGILWVHISHKLGP